MFARPVTASRVYLGGSRAYLESHMKRLLALLALMLGLASVVSPVQAHADQQGTQRDLAGSASGSESAATASLHAAVPMSLRRVFDAGRHAETPPRAQSQPMAAGFILLADRAHE
ncbi:hypothetical protein RM533_03975 [Croceicoccus sp. F390]|uniref:Uncharacterized protein n=1 Tax=Croceicoccus esteveae TaxID=3075597 RepID=A0ABU2ZFH7_9SPHN|nr:hypothetical protein [Croceicoccus sp. F390]MDT0575338.1 hypothetical protein [Croceicoccus sp. F390]